MWKVKTTNPKYPWHGMKGDILTISNQHGALMVNKGHGEFVAFVGNWPNDGEQIENRIRSREMKIMTMRAEIVVLKKQLAKWRAKRSERSHETTTYRS